MAGPICFATGNLWRWTKDNENRAKTFDFIKTLDISGIEITAGYPEEVLSFRLSQKQLKWIRSLDFVSMHSPFGFNRIEDERTLSKVMDKFYKLYRQVKAQAVVVHANHPEQIDHIKDNYDISLSIEHMEKRCGVNLREFSKLVKKYPEAKICMDTSHNYTWSVDETGKLIKKFGDRISHVHFSGTRYNHTHKMMGESAKKFFKTINPLTKTNYPIVIEEDMDTKSKRKVRDEVEIIRKLLEK